LHGLRLDFQSNFGAGCGQMGCVSGTIQTGFFGR
jgi:hypothetical protein